MILFFSHWTQSTSGENSCPRVLRKAWGRSTPYFPIAAPAPLCPLFLLAHPLCRSGGGCRRLRVGFKVRAIILGRFSVQIGAGLAPFLTKAGPSLGPVKTDPHVGGGKWRRAPPTRAGVRVIIRGRVRVIARCWVRVLVRGRFRVMVRGGVIVRGRVIVVISLTVVIVIIVVVVMVVMVSVTLTVVAVTPAVIVIGVTVGRVRVRSRAWVIVRVRVRNKFFCYRGLQAPDLVAEVSGTLFH